MCTTSMVAQDWADRNRYRWDNIGPAPINPQTNPLEDLFKKMAAPENPITRKEFDDLKTELQAVKKLLLAAKQYDKETGQPDCENDEKTELFRKLAKLCGVDLADVFPVRA